MSNPVDLSQLAVDRAPASRAASGTPARRWMTRYVLPTLMIATFIGLVSWAARDRLLPAREVTVVPVLVARAEVQQAGQPQFQAAGWVEPRPSATVVSSLVEGVVQEMLVVEGQQVDAGQPIARLLDTDAKIRLREAEADLQIRNAALAAAQAKLENAQAALQNPVQLRAALGEAEAALAEVDAQLHALPAAIEAAQTQLRLAQENVKSKQAAGDAVSGERMRQAQSDLATAQKTLQALKVSEPTLQRQKTALQNRRDALADSLELKLELRSRAADAQAALGTAQAQVARAELAIETARLNLQRTTIAAPSAGRILAVLASPGERVSGLHANSEEGPSAVVTMYDPAQLQVRIDVRLEDVSQVQIGQSVVIQTAASPAELTGKVISVTSLADIQKNTLQVKASIDDPPDVIRPEMLAQVTFLASLSHDDANDQSQRQRLLIPRELVFGTEDAAHVWVADRATGNAIKRSITLGRAGTNELIEATSGLGPTDKLINSGMESISDGERIHILASDTPTP